MSEQKNKEIILRFYKEFWEQGNLNVADDLIWSDVINHRPIPGFSSQIEAYKHIVKETNRGLSNIKWKYVGPIAEGDKVVCAWEWDAIHTGIFMGVKGSGNKLHESGIDLFRIREWKIAEIWHEESALETMQQLGIIVMK